jgi:hypothetical protein
MIVILKDSEVAEADGRNYRIYADLWQRKFGFPVPQGLARRWWPRAFDTAPTDVLDLDT